MLPEKKESALSYFQGKLTKLCKGQFVYPPVDTAHSAEGRIMEDNWDPVGGKLDINSIPYPASTAL